MSGQLLDFNNARKQGEIARGGVDADDIKSRLQTNVRSFVDWLYSGRAYYTKTEARIGNVEGELGSSLSIKLSTGEWYDHATETGGDLISLYRAWRGYHGDTNFVLSLKEIAHDFLKDPIEIERQAWHPTPAAKIEKQKAELGSKPRDENLQLGAPVATYKYYDLHGNIEASVVRFEPEGTRESKTYRPYCYKNIDGKDKWVMGAPDMRPLYRLPELATSPVVVLCEGEPAAEALNSIGIIATTAMQGAHAPIEKTNWTPLAGKTVIIWPDKDDPGFKYAQKVAEHLLMLKCTVRGITPPEDAVDGWDAFDCIQESRNAHALIEAAIPVTAQTAPRPRIQLLDIDEIENLAPPRWLVDTILTQNGLSVLWGRSGAMKSFVALDIALCVATGLAWHGKATQGGLVVYVAAEGAHGLGRRAIGWRRTRGRDLPKPQFKLIPHPVALTSDDLQPLIDALLALPTRPVLIILDTLARTFGTGDENKQADMNAYVNASDKLRDKTGANVMIIHHSGVHEDRRERGSNVLRGAADTVIKVSRKNHDLDIINQAPEGKQKDAEEFKTIKLTSVKVHFEQGKDEHSTLVLNLRGDDEASEPEGEDEAPTKLGKNEQAIIKVLREGDAFGFNRIQAMTSLNPGSIKRSLERLVDLGFAHVDYDESGNSKRWKIADE